LATMVLCFSCQFNQSPNNEDKTIKGIDPVKVQEPRFFTSSEIQIIQRICTELNSKKELFNSLPDSIYSFKFHLNKTECSKAVSANVDFTAFISNANGENLEYVSNRNDTFRDVLTDDNAPAKYLCDQISANNIANTYTSSKTTYSYNVLVDDGYDRLEMVKSMKDENGISSIKTMEYIRFITNTSQASLKYMGVEKLRTRLTNCGNNYYSVQEQSFLNPVKGF